MKTWMTLLFALQFLCSYSQFQVGVFGGVSDYTGDLLDKPYRFSRPATGLTLGYQFSDRFVVRAGATFGKIEGADSVNEYDHLTRNLRFQSSLSELAITAEYNLFSLDDKRWTPFAFTGLALYHYNPYTFDQQAQKFYLQPLGTEGQGLLQYPDRKPYALTRVSVPVGGGVKFILSDKFQLAAQIGLRITNNDYLDDVSSTYVDEGALLNARGAKAVELSYRVRELPNGDQSYPAEGAGRGRSGGVLFTDFYYFSGLHFIYSFSGGSGFLRNGWNKKQLQCPSL